MASNSVIGALRVDLGLNSAQFTTGLKKAQTGLSSFGKAAAVVASAVVAVGTALAIGTKRAIDHADALNKSAQKAGVAVEALSRLEYAAKLSDISLEQLTGGLQKLSKSMADAAIGQGPVTAFKALGVAVRDGLGNLRDGNEVFSDIADRFSRMEDGALKTALSMQIFGKSGAELIPLLNEGRAGLKGMADESDRLGATINGRTAAAAEQFNDTLTRIDQVMQGVVNKIMEAALPALQDLANKLSSPEFATAAQTLATNVIGAIGQIVGEVTRLINKLNELKNMDIWTFLGSDEFGAFLDPNLPKLRKKFQSWMGWDTNGVGGGITGGGPGSLVPTTDDVGAGIIGGGPLLTPPAAAPFLPDVDDLKKVNTEFDVYTKMLAQVAPLMQAANDPFSDLTHNMDTLGALLAAGSISWEQYGEAAERANWVAAEGVASMASDITGTLAQVFEGNKAFAVANAVVNGIEAVSKAMTAYPFPWNIGAAAAQAALSAKSVADILSTTSTTKSMPSAPSGAGAVTGAGGAGSGSGVTLVLRGSESSMVSMGSVEGIIKAITENLADGGGSNLIRVIKEAA